MNPLLRLLGAAASNGLLTGQIVFSTAFVGACELPNWIQAPREVNACLERSSALALFLSGMQTAMANNQPALAPGRIEVWLFDDRMEVESPSGCCLSSTSRSCSAASACTAAATRG